MDAYIPLSTWRSRVGDFVMWRIPGGIEGEVVELSQITVSVDSIEDVDETAGAIETLLKQFHDKEDYAVVVPKELLEQAARTRAMFNVLLVVIAGISLLVGGIGIMNIMLANVTERTREIGIRRAIGAKRGHIIQQFLTETLVLTGIGGLLGVAFGLLCGPLFRGLRAAITVAHRLSTAREADRVVVMQDGRIVEEGPPEELIRRGGRFAALVELEAAGWDWQDSV